MTKIFTSPLGLKAVIGLLVLCLIAVACGAGETPSATQNPVPPTSSPPTTASPDTSQTPGSQTPPSAAAESFNSVLPDVEVVRIATNEELLLSSLTPSDRPLLLWFWAPH